MTALIDAATAIGEVSQIVAGLPVYIAGSSAASAQPHAPSDTAYDDIDLFFASESGVIAGVQRFLDAGYIIEPRHQRVWSRWMKMGLGKWHTHSIKLVSPTSPPMDVNCVFKIVDGHPTTSAAQVIESFDFGLLSHAFDCELMVWRDMRSYLFPQIADLDGPLPLLPLRQASWQGGFISQYQGLREIGRYIKYLDYGWDLSLVKPDLVTGYWSVSKYLLDRGDPERTKLGGIYETLALNIEQDDFTLLRDAAKEIMFMDDLDKIMEALE
ncbi:hypothetical protein SEA_BURRO_20 [Microbacterium phage Burro]|uniref:Uncharacterized protein n=1 Tax=Microbacterium phage Burro TaxID=2315703 RepID=A0A386KNS4_9CAUD|nr:hypothetical protein HWB89_gp20 [Microbacterium phage Burro]AYD86163.1 hypothetical protein SEA_BURRO_20 [Microbacterium phage Burro]